MNFGRRLREIRKSRNLVLETVAEATGIAVSTLSEYENSKYDTSLRHLYILLDFYCINLIHFIKNGEEWVNILIVLI